jgi:hypothetical protein
VIVVGVGEEFSTRHNKHETLTSFLTGRRPSPSSSLSVEHVEQLEDFLKGLPEDVLGLQTADGGAAVVQVAAGAVQTRIRRRRVLLAVVADVLDVLEGEPHDVVRVVAHHPPREFSSSGIAAARHRRP